MVTYTNGRESMELSKEQFHALIRRIQKESQRRKNLAKTELGRKILEREDKQRG